MQSDAHSRALHVVVLPGGSLEAIRPWSKAAALRLRDHPSLEALIADDLAEDVPWIVVAVGEAASLLPAGLKAITQRHPAARIVVLAESLAENDERRLLLAGACRVQRPPLSPVDGETLFHDTGYLAVLFPGSLRGRRLEIHELEVPSRKELVTPVIRLLSSRLDRFGYPADLVRSVVPLVIDEAVTNAMKHGNRWDESKLVSIRAEISTEGFELSVTDRGEGFARGEVADPLRRENLDVEGGRGLFLMEQLMDDVRYENGGRTVVLRRRAPALVSLV